MGRKFTVIPQSTFDDMQLDAGVLLTSFNPSNPVAPADSAIICATTGGINAVCKPTYSDTGEDVDNAPTNVKELKQLDGWECSMAFTSLGTSPANIRLALGAADIDATNGKITPRATLSQNDFSDVWWVGDKAGGGLVAVQLKNALSTEGFSLQTTKAGKGQTAVTLTGHVSISAQSVVPMVFYSLESDGSDYYSVTQILSHMTSTYEGASIDAGDNFEATLSAEASHTITNVVVLYDGEDVTSTKYNSSTHKVSISSVAGDIEIIATAVHS